MKKNILLVWLFGVATLSGAQTTTLQVVTNTLVQSVPWKPGMSLEINSEKAEIEVKPGTGNAILVKTELSARHPQLDSAKTDLKAWKWVVNTFNKKIFLRAYVGVVAGKRLPTSNMRAKIVVEVPEACPVTLLNKFGKAVLQGLSAPVALSGEFCDFRLVQLNGPVDVDSRFGDVTAQAISGKMNVQCRRATVNLREMRADCAVRSEYGTVNVAPDAQTGNVWVRGEKSNVVMQLAPSAAHQIYLTAEYGQVKAPATFQQSQPNDHSQKATRSTAANQPTLTVETAFGNISVE